MSGSVLVLGDSLSYYDETGGLSADDRRIWPNIVGERVGRRVELFARIGWTSRDVWWATTQDPRIWAALPHADVLVLAYGGMDSLPSPLPTALREQIRYIRPAALRQRVRDVYSWLQPRLSPLGWPMALPPRVTVDYCEKVRGAVAHLRPDLPIVVCLPPTHDSPYYGNVHPGRIPTTTAIERWAREHGLPTVSFYETTAAAFADPATTMNPDGIHWSVATHAAIAEVTAPVVEAALTAIPAPATV
ncbi:SGNH/GDSL hydrolase family protein [Gordonia sp. HY002]|uniref:diglucosylglycerate octanoyltransferase n=1 Tax=Gordonia zhenghanii TaxID=2911516 RepID=UPI001EF112A7|nr:diglucosylglycerate octanoyltransferase [Gordonia zhenghanii]MCF8572294.1 SGNH/GDSL hydrolase family protein [Gordonia zhenghanii]MCF8605999.1 SGNH/GDSL hydrolase family protein [Gordonia zhenghanii]